MDAQVNDFTHAFVRLAGGGTNANSTNDTFNGFWNKAPVYFDQYYIMFEAPREVRTATSFWRVVPLESSKLATFTHAIKSTKPTEPSSSHRVWIRPPSPHHLPRVPKRESGLADEGCRDREDSSK